MSSKSQIKRITVQMNFYIQSQMNTTLLKSKRKDGLIMLLLQMGLEKQRSVSNTEGQNGCKKAANSDILPLGAENFFCCTNDTKKTFHQKKHHLHLCQKIFL